MICVVLYFSSQWFGERFSSRMFSTAWRLPCENDRRLKKLGSEKEHLFFPLGSLYIFSDSVSKFPVMNLRCIVFICFVVLNRDICQ
uniref:Bm14716 n=1 Tax=Brugia malayi TaxID=6279 RepID=A0A0J9XQS3_BRUMA|nr:Bm14716 [Brugia malayi]